MKIVDTSKMHAMPARERILFTAHDLFYREGIRAIGVDKLIAASAVTKVTFYRHFPSKNDLIREYLEFRHQRWMAWFSDSLLRHGNTIKALVKALKEWFGDSGFRGCAFINGIAELGEVMPEVIEITRRHKQEMTEAIMQLLPVSNQRLTIAQLIAMAVDGAIIRAQIDRNPETALKGLKKIITLLLP